MTPTIGQPDGQVEGNQVRVCSVCDGSGMTGSGQNYGQCPECHGTGVVIVIDEDEDGDDLGTTAEQLDHLSASRREFTTKQRQAYAASGVAMKDGSYPIPDRASLRDAIQALGRAKNPSAVEAHILARARALKAKSLLPKTWRTQKSVTLDPNDCDELLADLFHLPGEVRARVRAERARERAIVRESRRLKELAWASHPHLVARRREFSEYERLMGG